MSNTPSLSPRQREVLLSALARDGLVPQINTLIARSLEGKGLIEDAPDEMRTGARTLYMLTARGFEMAKREKKRREKKFGDVTVRKI